MVLIGTRKQFSLTKAGFYALLLCVTVLLVGCDNRRMNEKSPSVEQEPVRQPDVPDNYQPVYALFVVPENPAPGESFRIVALGGKNLHKGKITVTGPSGELEPQKSKTGSELPFWRVDEFAGSPAGVYNVVCIEDRKTVSSLEFTVSEQKKESPSGVVWKTQRSWDDKTEALYSAWVNALFFGCSEDDSWKSLHEIVQNPDRNFLYNYLSLDEDNPQAQNKLIMQPDCADNPFFMRAYFAWKLGLPFGYHVCDRGYVGKSPGTGQWVTNESGTSKSNPVLAFNSFMRRVMDGVHSGTARTAFDNNSSDYYPVALDRASLRPGTVFADPYGHTLTLIRWKPQTSKEPGLLLSVDAQPDGTVGIKRFWKGNFLFTTSEVVGEPGFKAFRPIRVENGRPAPIDNQSLATSDGFIPFSLQQKKMESEVFYRSMERLINPKPLDPEAALLDLIQALHEQLTVRVTSVANGDAYYRSHPGTVIPMPSNASGIFLAGGQWENFSTPNRDLRLLIAMDAVLGFPEKVAQSPSDFDIPALSSPEKEKEKLQSLLEKTVAGLTITYPRSDGSSQTLTVAEILKRKEAFEIAYNPNDGPEVRWGAPENSDERSTCKRFAPPFQRERMLAVRSWFQKRLHPPT